MGSFNKIFKQNIIFKNNIKIKDITLLKVIKTYEFKVYDSDGWRFEPLGCYLDKE